MSPRPVQVKVTADTARAVRGLNDVDSSITGIDESASKSSGWWKKLGMAAGGAALLGLQQAVKLSADFADSQNVLASSLGLSGAAAETAKTQLGDLAKELGSSTVYSAQDASDAMVELAKAGMSQAEIAAGGVQGAMALAATEGINLADSATLMTQALAAFGLEAEQAGKVADILAAGATASTASVEDLALGLKYVGSTAHSLGVDLDDTTTALALLNSAGLDSSTAGTSLNRMLLGISAPSKNAQKALDELGVKFTDAKGEALPLVDIIDDLSKSVEGMSSMDRAEILKRAFGVEGMRAANILLQENVEGWEAMNEAVNETGRAQQMAEARTRDLNGAMETFRGSMETLGIIVGDKVRPVLTDMLNFVNDRIMPGILEFADSLDVSALIDQAKESVVGLKGAFDGVTLEDFKGNLEAAGAAAQELAEFGGAAMRAFNDLSPETKKNLALIVAAGAAVGLAQKNPVVKIGVDLVSGTVQTIATTMASAMASRMFDNKFAQRVIVTNWPAVYPDGPDGAGGGKGKGGVAAVGRTGAITIASLALPWLLDQLGASEKFNKAASVAAYSAMGFQYFGPIGAIGGAIYGDIATLTEQQKAEARLRMELGKQVSTVGAATMTNAADIDRVDGEHRRDLRGTYGLITDLDGKKASKSSLWQETEARRRETAALHATNRWQTDQIIMARERAARLERLLRSGNPRPGDSGIRPASAAAATATIVVQTLDPADFARQMRLYSAGYDLSAGRAPGSAIAAAW